MKKSENLEKSIERVKHFIDTNKSIISDNEKDIKEYEQNIQELELFFQNNDYPYVVKNACCSYIVSLNKRINLSKKVIENSLKIIESYENELSVMQADFDFENDFSNMIMTEEGFVKLNKNTVNTILAKCNNDTNLIIQLQEERIAICENPANYQLFKGVLI